MVFKLHKQADMLELSAAFRPSVTVPRHVITIKTYTKPANGSENFFAKLKQYQAIATCYNKRTTNFLAAIYLAASVIWLN